ncbi:461R [Invertebrate iridescent virus Kaz2018]|uniref:461R n=1 Tax=Invertebrate iridescent virus 6 TaxID=176652 RepID=Q91F65_IIV6|nr:461R [Invertebrate iridescent virus 6]AAK82321.1 461R [Invertebrate iridescent virus 6]QMS79476.1 hypothetical protein IIV6-T1_451 [Invertebrate iridescent virus 6]QNH08871.1 461R [Invertebrate iridescent virus Kaz2018]
MARANAALTLRLYIACLGEEEMNELYTISTNILFFNKTRFFFSFVKHS